MSTLLHIDSSPLGDASISRHLSAEFVKNWKEANPEGEIIVRDLAATSIPPLDGAWVGAVYTLAESRTAAQNEKIALSDELIGELGTANEWVIGVPMHNFSTPSTLKLWIDQVVRVGRTFSYGEAGPVGLLKGKKITFLVASGGIYSKGTPMASYDFVEPYLRALFGFLGINDLDFVVAGGVSAVMSGKADRATFLKPFDEAIDSRFQAAA
jgi:FMN-dependent NADH-azoreductase